jgi:hypothetical protein
MNVKVIATVLSVGTLIMPAVSRADDAAIGGAIAGAIVGAAIASGVPVERREPLREYVVRERPPSYVYDEEVVVGRELPPGPYESREVPEEYGVPGHHYAVINNRAVIFHPQTRRIIHVYDPYDD